MRILKKEKVVAEYPPQAPGAAPQSRTLRGQLFSRETLAGGETVEMVNRDFRFELLTPTGWREFLEPSKRNGEVTWEREDNRVIIRTPYPEEYVVIDNRGRGPVRVAFGELELPVEADTARAFRFDFSQDVYNDYEEPSSDAQEEDRANSWEVKLDDEVIGVMERGSRCLIDATGARTYRLQEVLYTINLNPFREDDTFSAEYSGARFHCLADRFDEIDFLFTPPAEEVETFGYSDQRKWQLTEVVE